ncbi:MAG: methylenetetrahydrofolate--tRNA-(uracil(54)-C(5))-methyltransferase (FADH(2)-oxidizing) TrmFO [Clostridiales bacterium]|nr:MAG: methylenetetrahydrofolate--tRNA-(uracil(54)-C(5))-methyltransferase (FADH(2)-oxidizing) TrmFO [Clostridiales bacterium]
MSESVQIIGAGLAGSEAAWQLAQRGIKVDLYEMRPTKQTCAHKTGYFGELVCSNSLRADNVENAVGLLKEEMRRLDSLIISCADHNRLPAGGALAVDREKFAREITDRVTNHPLITVHYEELSRAADDGVRIIATGPLTDGAMAEYVKSVTDDTDLYFYDAAAPIVTAESIDYDSAFWASRYDKGEADYLNCPLTKEEYEHFYQELMQAEWVESKNFEKEIFFEGCMPIEVMASRGFQTLLFGPMKPVGLTDPHTGQQPYAVVQLRKDNQEGTLLNIVGFQTRMKWGPQERVLRLIPALEQAEFVRLGVMHRNSFINAPANLLATNQLKSDANLFFAGQITGVEGYVESAASGLVSGINAARVFAGKSALEFPTETAIGGLMHYIATSEAKSFQPMNVNFSLVPPLGRKIRDKREKNALLAQRSLAKLAEFMQTEMV